MTVTITLTTAGTDTGPFNLYSDVDGFVSAFETGVSKAALLAGYTTSLVPNGTTIIRVMSANELCTNFIDIVLGAPCTTTTTTTICYNCYEYTIDVIEGPVDVQWIECVAGTIGTLTGLVAPSTIGCDGAKEGSVIVTSGTANITQGGFCREWCPTTTTTTTAPPECLCYHILNETGGPLDYTYIECGSLEPNTYSLGAGLNTQVCSPSVPTGFSLTIYPCTSATNCTSSGECEGCS